LAGGFFAISLGWIMLKLDLLGLYFDQAVYEQLVCVMGGMGCCQNWIVYMFTLNFCRLLCGLLWA
jgi:hypothetical protein